LRVLGPTSGSHPTSFRIKGFRSMCWGRGGGGGGGGCGLLGF